ncbi:MAG TPA: transposase [bacterium]|nr:transposase [bacterium]
MPAGKLSRFNEGLHFVTTKTYRNHTYFADTRCCEILIEQLDYYRGRYGFKISGYVIMPDHLHVLLWWETDEKPDLTISKIMQGIKSIVAKRIIQYVKIGESTCSRLSDDWYHENPHKRMGQEHTPPSVRIWQPSFYDYIVLSQEKFVEKLSYMHNNPVNAGLVSEAELWKFSSCAWYTKRKEYVLEMDGNI